MDLLTADKGHSVLQSLDTTSEFVKEIVIFFFFFILREDKIKNMQFSKFLASLSLISRVLMKYELTSRWQFKEACRDF